MAGKKDTGIGNKNGEKYKTPEERQALFDDYCEHVKKGYSDQCFPDCDMRTFEYYVTRYASMLQTEMIEKARRERQLFWEKLGTAGTAGKVKGFNSVSWKYNMANRFKWAERREDTVSVLRDGAADLASELLADDGDESNNE